MRTSIPALLRITVTDAPGAMTLRLEGRLSGAMVDELRTTWSALLPTLRGRIVTVDLRDAVYVDQAGLAVLADIHRQSGAHFEVASPLSQYFAEQATRVQTQHETLKGA